MKNKNLRALIVTAILAAMSIVLGKFAAINIGDTLRFSFENLPIMLASFIFGPIYGASCGLVADVLGCILRGYAINPGITAASVLMGVIPGLLSRTVFKGFKIPSVVASGFISHVVCSMIVKTAALHIYYSTPYPALLLQRIPTYIVIGLLESYICALLIKQKVIKKEISLTNSKEKNKVYKRKNKTELTFDEAIRFVESTSWKGSVPGLERINELCKLLGHPERKVKFVHVAGTNGKGSVTAIVSSVLRSAGYKTGAFTSPHLIDYCERITVDGRDVSKQDFCTASSIVKEAADKMKDAPTEFEILTAIAFVHFALCGCDVAVLECGMGGRLDSTNVISSPLVSVITNVALDHTSVLGNTETEIAREKAGIIKSAPLVLGAVSAKVKKQITGICRKAGVPVKYFDNTIISKEQISRKGLTFTYKSQRMTLPLSGEYQKINLRTALTVIEVLRNSGYNVSAAALKQGVENVRWIGRFETLHRDPDVIFDGAHNPDGAHYAALTFKELYPGKKAILVSGVMADKDYTALVKELAPFVSEAFTVRPDNNRALSPEDYAEVFMDLGIKATPCASVKDGLSKAAEFAERTALPVFCCGSLYMYGEVVSAIKDLFN